MTIQEHFDFVNNAWVYIATTEDGTNYCRSAAGKIALIPSPAASDDILKEFDAAIQGGKLATPAEIIADNKADVVVEPIDTTPDQATAESP